MFDRKSFAALTTVLVIAVDAKLYLKNNTGTTYIERIIGGYAVNIQNIPYQVSIHDKNGGLCGGSIISPFHILTAAHCFLENPNSPSEFWVRSGSSYPDYDGVVNQVSQIISHENFTDRDGDIISNDIAILVLKEPLHFNNSTQQIKLISKHPQNGEEALISGWGITGNMKPSTVLRAVRVPVTTEIERCQKEVDKICTVSSRKIGTCIGDSGGPVAVEGFLAAVVSEGDPRGCGIPDSPDLSSSVVYFKDWIMQKMAQTTSSRKSELDRSDKNKSINPQIIHLL